MAMESIKFDVNMVRKLSMIFNLSLSKLIEPLTDRLLEERKVDEALSLITATEVCTNNSISMKIIF